jgi:hypothetical protein
MKNKLSKKGEKTSIRLKSLGGLIQGSRKRIEMKS